MLSDVVTNKSAAIADIRGAILGLLIVIGAVVLLNTINPEITKTTLRFTDVVVDPVPEIDERLLAEVDLICNGELGCSLANCPYTDATNQTEACTEWCTDQFGPSAYIPPNSGINSNRCVYYNPATIGSSLYCELSTDIEEEVYRNTCEETIVAVTAGSCENLYCQVREIDLPELTCEGNSCSCSFSDEDPQPCVESCQQHEDYVSHNINSVDNTVTCLLDSEPDDPSLCDEEIPICCFKSLPTCQPENVCRSYTHPSDDLQICFLEFKD